MKRTIRHILITGSIILMSGFLVNAMSVKKDEKNIYEQAEELSFRRNNYLRRY